MYRFPHIRIGMDRVDDSHIGMLLCDLAERLAKIAHSLAKAFPPVTRYKDRSRTPGLFVLLR